MREIRLKESVPDTKGLVERLEEDIRGVQGIIEKLNSASTILGSQDIEIQDHPERAEHCVLVGVGLAAALENCAAELKFTIRQLEYVTSQLAPTSEEVTDKFLQAA
jgi:fructose-specific phosphotransferase system component IIB